MDYSSKTVVELKKLLKDRNLSANGKKIDLIHTLQENDIQIEEKEKRFKVYIKRLVGSYYTIYIDQSATILDLKYKIREKTGCVENKQILYLLCNDVPSIGDITYQDGTIGKRINDTDTLLSLGVHNEMFFYLQRKF